MSNPLNALQMDADHDSLLYDLAAVATTRAPEAPFNKGAALVDEAASEHLCVVRDKLRCR